jgi:hypothetical protein
MFTFYEQYTAQAALRPIGCISRRWISISLPSLMAREFHDLLA